MKFNMKEIMKKAWEIKNADRRNHFGLCLQIAWEEAKKMDTKELTIEEKIEKLENAGAKRWQKNGLDRLYINAGVIGYEWTTYKTGCVSHAEFNGSIISHSEMNRVLMAKTYIDVKTMKVYSSYNDDAYRAAVDTFISEALSA